jgi:phosphate-selective porin
VYGSRLTAFLEANIETYPLYDDIVEGKVRATERGNNVFYTGD